MTGCPCTGPCLCAPEWTQEFCPRCEWRVYMDGSQVIVEVRSMVWHAMCWHKETVEQCLDNDDARDAGVLS